MLDHTPEAVISILAFFGAILGLGHLFVSDDPLTWRKVFGRAIVSAGLSSSATLILLVYPTAPLIVILGMGASLASLGTSGLELLVQKVVNKQ